MNKEISRRVDTYLVECTCDVCETGVMRPTGMVLTSIPPRLEHECVNCKTRGYYEYTYPRVQYKERT